MRQPRELRRREWPTTRALEWLGLVATFLLAAELVSCAGSRGSSGAGGQRELDLLEPSQAVAVLRAKLSRSPNDARAHLQLGRRLAEMDSLAPAAASFDRAEALDLSLHQELTALRRDSADRAARRGETLLADGLAAGSRSPGGADRLRQAAEMLALAERFDAENGAVQVGLYRVSGALGDTAAAERHLTAATRLAEAGRLTPPVAAGLYREEGQAAVRRREYRQGISAFEKAARLTPDDPDLLIDLATAHLLQVETSGEAVRKPADAYREAIELLESARRLRPADTEALYSLATIRYRTGEFDQADLLLRDYLSQRIDDPDAWQLLQQVLERLGQAGPARTAALAGDLLAADRPAANAAEWAAGQLQRNGGGSDLGRAYSTLGTPQRIDYRQNSSGRITEVWFYLKPGRVLAFRNGEAYGTPIELAR